MTSRFRLFVWTLPVLGVLIAASALVSGQAGSTSGEWPHWGADLGSSKYSALDQINRDNVKNLRVAWRWKSENFGPRPQNNMEATPLMVGGVLYTTAGFRPNVVAIDAATGETLWSYRLDEGAARRPGAAQRQPRRRVLDRWQAGAHHPRHARLPTGVARRQDRAARSGVRHQRRGRPVPGLRSAAARRRRHQLDVASRRRAKRRVFGAAMVGGTAPRSKENTKGTSAATTCAAASVCGRSTPFRSRASSATTRGSTIRGRTPVTPRCGRHFPPTKSSGTSICRSKHRRETSTADIARATTCSPAVSCASMPGPASASGINSSCITTSGTTTWPRRPT